MTSTHLDKRASALVASGSSANPDELLSTVAVASWLGISPPRLESWRSMGLGPIFIKVSHRCIRYSRRDVLSWLQERSCSNSIDAKKLFAPKPAKPTPRQAKAQ